MPSTVGNDGDDLSHGTSTRASSPRGSVYTPLKTPSQLEVRAIPSLSSLNNDKLYDMSIDTAIEICPDLDGDEDLQTWMSKLSPQNIVSRDSISTANTTLYDDRSVNGNGLTIDTSNISRYRTGSSSVSASGESIYSTSTMAADVYGWEEELERQVLEKQSSTADGRRVSVGSGVGLGFGPIQSSNLIGDLHLLRDRWQGNFDRRFSDVELTNRRIAWIAEGEKACFIAS